jgi:hypothetical protein
MANVHQGPAVPSCGGSCITQKRGPLLERSRIKNCSYRHAGTPAYRRRYFRPHMPEQDVRAYALLEGRRAIFSHVSSSSSSRYSLTGNSLPHDVQRMVTAFQPILRTTSLLHALHFINTFNQLMKVYRRDRRDRQVAKGCRPLQVHDILTLSPAVFLCVLRALCGENITPRYPA